MQLLEFAHKEGENANQTIERFEAAMKLCVDQGVKTDEDVAKRMLISRCAERYDYLRQAYLLSSGAARQNMETLKARMRDIDAKF